MFRLTLIFTIGIQIVTVGQGLKGQVFILAESYIEDKCEVSAECDCCASDLFFLTDKEFAMINLCLFDDSYYKGVYSIKSNKLILTFKPKEVHEITDEQIGKEKLEAKDVPIKPMEFILSQCEDKVRLENLKLTYLKNGSRYSIQQEKEKTKSLLSRQAWKLLSQ